MGLMDGASRYVHLLFDDPAKPECLTMLADAFAVLSADHADRRFVRQPDRDETPLEPAQWTAERLSGVRQEVEGYDIPGVPCVPAKVRSREEALDLLKAIHRGMACNSTREALAYAWGVMAGLMAAGHLNPEDLDAWRQKVRSCPSHAGQGFCSYCGDVCVNCGETDHNSDACEGWEP